MNLKRFTHEFQLEMQRLERMEGSVDASRKQDSTPAASNNNTYNFRRGLQLYMVFRYTLSSKEVGTTRALWSAVSTTIAQILSVYSILLLQTAFNLQDEQVIRTYFDMYISKRLTEENASPQQQSNSDTHNSSDSTNARFSTFDSTPLSVEIYMYILGQVKMMRSSYSYKDALSLWENLEKWASQGNHILPNSTLIDIAPLIAEACYNANINTTVIYRILDSVLGALHKRGLYPSPELIHTLLSNQHVLPLETLLSKYSSPQFSYDNLIQGVKRTLRDTRASSLEIETEMPEPTRDALKDFVVQVVYPNFPKKSFEFMGDEERDSWLMERIRNEHPSKLPTLLKLYSWTRLIYQSPPSANVLACFVQQMHRIEPQSAKLSYILSLRVSLGRSSLSDSILYLAMRQYFLDKLESVSVGRQVGGVPQMVSL
eukprot:CAMPEP_0117455498 /NCGR_PEP_ID=MMETSP0759-20121206/11394_1 /TAXON_ID=63605 /ORGANISM="Percolomonas cosmopolitus, Strain WS" /LENGTH=428 /DNA_ID=CAMNT_0005248811 /DNA_START=393 /DNA_END=1679 /DNA_ORIENTATION=-